MQTFAKQNLSQKPVASSLARPKMATPGPGHREHPLLRLQRTIGNQAVLRMLKRDAEEPEVGLTGTASPRFGHDFSQIPIHSPAVGAIQAKLAINRPGDEYEQEADRVSEQVMRMPEPPTPQAGPDGAGCPECRAEPPGQERVCLQAKHPGSNDMGQAAAPPIIDEVLHSPGEPLDAATRTFMEARFDHDFSNVRVHTDSKAADGARAVQARAYTIGRDVGFGPNEYAPATGEGKRLLAHELAHVVQQAAGPRVLARQPVEQYERQAVYIDPEELNRLADIGYWGQKIETVFGLDLRDPLTARQFKNTQERDAVLSVVWQMVSQKGPQPAITGEEKSVVAIPNRQQAATSASQNLVYQIIFRPRIPPEKRDIVICRFVASGAGAVPVVLGPPANISDKAKPAYSWSDFPSNADSYWSAHPEEQRRVFSWIDKAGQNFDQVITTTVQKGNTTESASFKVWKTKQTNDRLNIRFLGAVTPSAKTPPAGYASPRDLAEEKIEEVKAIDPLRKDKDKLGTIAGLDGLPADEKPSVRLAIWGYIINGTRDAEVDAIVPIAKPGSARVLYTFFFKPDTNDSHTINVVDIKRIGKEGKDVSLEPQADLAHVNGFSAHIGGNPNDVKPLKDWLKKTRYPDVTPIGVTISEVQNDVTKKIRDGSGDTRWFEANYGIKVLNKEEADVWLVNIVNKDERQDLKNFQAGELRLLERVLETMSDKIVESFKDLRLIRQKVFYEFKPGPSPHFEPKPNTAGITITGAGRTIIIFDQSTINDSSLFLGGSGYGNKPAVEIASAQTYAHEFGHTVHQRPGVKDEFESLVNKKKKIKPITRYAESDPEKEFFAESFSLYYSDPESLKQNWPDLYNFFDKLDKDPDAYRPKPKAKSRKGSP
jgi:hypothetical protein